MVLGQCMEVLRNNQRRVAMSLSQEGLDGRVDTREVKRGLAVVPFRHSKLTEALMDYFVGDARAVGRFPSHYCLDLCCVHHRS
jgi:kinesin family protein 20